MPSYIAHFANKDKKKIGEAEYGNVESTGQFLITLAAHVSSRPDLAEAEYILIRPSEDS